GQERGHELVVVACVGVERRVNPLPRGVAVWIAAVRAEPELRDETRRRTRLVGHTVDPELAVDVLGPVHGADHVRGLRWPLEVGPADDEMGQSACLVRWFA